MSNVSRLVFSKKPTTEGETVEDTIAYAPEPNAPCAIVFPEDSQVAWRLADGDLMVSGNNANWRVFIGHLCHELPGLDGTQIYTRCFTVNLGREDPGKAHEAVCRCLERTFGAKVTTREVATMELDLVD